MYYFLSSGGTGLLTTVYKPSLFLSYRRNIDRPVGVISTKEALQYLKNYEALCCKNITDIENQTSKVLYLYMQLMHCCVFCKLRDELLVRCEVLLERLLGYGDAIESKG